MAERGRRIVENHAQRGLFDDPLDHAPSLNIPPEPTQAVTEGLVSAVAPDGPARPAVPTGSGLLTSVSSDRPPTPAPAGPVTDPPPTTAPDSPVQPFTFDHAAATREIRLGAHRVRYALRRGRRRTIGFVVGVEGLSVSAPQWVRISDVEAALQEKSAWILRKLVEQQERSRRLQAARVDWRDGTTLPFLGEPVIVVIDPRATGAVLDAGAQSLPGVARLLLRVGLSHDAQPEQIRDAVQSWLQRQARRVFEERCAHFAKRLKVNVRRITLSSAQTRWGSARADGSVWLNWRLVHFAMPTIDYVVAHELAHLRHMDHSPKFWDVVRSVIPDVAAERDRLRDNVVPVLD